MHEIILGYQGEMSLKGLNRNQFESAMMKILRYRLKTVGKFKVYCTQSTFYMEPEEEDARCINASTSSNEPPFHDVGRPSEASNER